MLSSLKTLTAKQISALPVEELVQLRSLVNKQLDETKLLKEKLDDGLSLRFLPPMQQELQNQGRDTGTVHLLERNFKITAEIPKKVSWDPEKIEQAMKLLSESTRKDLIHVSYSVDERLYLSLPPQYREILAPARTVTPGKIHFKFALRTPGENQ